MKQCGLLSDVLEPALFPHPRASLSFPPSCSSTSGSPGSPIRSAPTDARRETFRAHFDGALPQTAAGARHPTAASADAAAQGHAPQHPLDYLFSDNVRDAYFEILGTALAACGTSLAPPRTPPPTEGDTLDHLLSKTVRLLPAARTLQQGDVHQLEWLALKAALDTAPYHEAKPLLGGLLRNLAARPALEDWEAAFEELFALCKRFERRTMLAANQLMLASSADAAEQSEYLALISTRGGFDRLVASRLHAITSMPQPRGARAWFDLLTSLQRCDDLLDVAQLTRLAEAIPLLPADTRNAASLTLVGALEDAPDLWGWNTLFEQLCLQASPDRLAPILDAILDVAGQAAPTALKDIVESMSAQIHRLTPLGASELLTRLARISVRDDEFVDAEFTTLESTAMLARLLNASERDLRAYARPDLRAMLFRLQGRYRLDLA